MSPDHPLLRGTAQNPDVFFQAREAINPFYRACPTIVQDVMDRFAQRTGRSYHLFDYVGAPDAERVIVMMGSGAGAVEETVEQSVAAGRKGWASEGPALPAFCGRSVYVRASEDSARPSRSWIAPKSRAAWANRSTWMW